MRAEISAKHLELEAIVYVRQSTAGQVVHNLESQRVQYRLTERAESLGWRREQVLVIDQDLGVSASGVSRRNGFEDLLTRVCEGKVGAIFSVEASRLARNGREWHTLLELCAVVGTLLVDHDCIYDPQLTDDRLLLGLKGEMSTMELRFLHQRSASAIAEKAGRGEYYTRIAIGYEKTKQGLLRKDPNVRVRETLELAFSKFVELGSINKSCIWFRDNGIEFPYIAHVDGERVVEWKLPQVNTLNRLLSNPLYAGAYAFGRTITETRLEGGRRINYVRRQDSDKWKVLIADHHEGYISWEQYLANNKIIRENALMHGERVRGAVRQGSALLTGLLRCGHCGRKLIVAYRGRNNQHVMYSCRGLSGRTGGKACIDFGGWRVDKAIAEQIVELISGYQTEAFYKAIEIAEQKEAEVLRQRELSLDEARYAAKRAKRCYDAVDPDNRLVSASLEKDWNEALLKVNELEAELCEVKAKQCSLSPSERAELQELAGDFPRIWEDVSADVVLKKRIVRTVIKEVVAYVEKERRIRLVIHWEGGEHSQVYVRKAKAGENRYADEPEMVDLLRELSKTMPDSQIAACLNRLGVRSSKGLTWTRERICSFRDNHDIPVYNDEARRLRGELTLDELAETLQLPRSATWRLLHEKIIPAKQPCRGAPWIVKKTDLESESVQKAIATRLRHGPRSANSEQRSFNF